jgi:carboxypeptidase PM20D1
MGLFKPLLKKLLPSISSAAGAMIKTTLAFTMAKGADGLNVLPQEAYVTVNMRFIHHQPNKECFSLLSELGKKYQIEVEPLYNDEPCPIVDYNSKEFHLIEDIAAQIYPGVGICPYTMTGGTDAKFYKEICQNALRFAPIYIDEQQYASIHGVNENVYQGALSKAVDFYKLLIKKC